MGFRAMTCEDDVCEGIREDCPAGCVNCDPSEPHALCHARYLAVMGILEDAEAALYSRPDAI